MPSASAAPEFGLDAVVFDFDGVILESGDIKTAAFAALFEDYPGHVDAIVALHQAHGGISRHTKFEWIYRDILHEPLSDARRAWLGQRFEALVKTSVLACPMVPGASDALQALSGRVPLAIASGTPHDELIEIVEARQLRRYFNEVHGSPRLKPEIISTMLTENGWRPERVVMVGDAITDWSAAAATGLAFIGRVPPGQESPFPQGGEVISDLTDLVGAIRRVVRARFQRA